MNTTEHERRYFQRIKDNYATTPAPENIAVYAKSNEWREVLIAPIPTIEVVEPDKYGARLAYVGDMTVGWIGPSDTPADWRDLRDSRLMYAGGAEAVARWIETNPQRDPQPDPESVARMQAARAVLAMLTDAERAEALR